MQSARPGSIYSGPQYTRIELQATKARLLEGRMEKVWGYGRTPGHLRPAPRVGSMMEVVAVEAVVPDALCLMESLSCVPLFGQ